MTHEIAFLMELFLEDDHKKIKALIKGRMAEVTDSLTAIPAPQRTAAQVQFYTPDTERIVMAQAPSTQRIMQNNPDLIPKVAPPVTPAAAQALAARQALIEGANRSKPEAGRTSPRKV